MGQRPQATVGQPANGGNVIADNRRGARRSLEIDALGKAPGSPEQQTGYGKADERKHAPHDS